MFSRLHVYMYSKKKKTKGLVKQNTLLQLHIQFIC